MAKKFQKEVPASVQHTIVEALEKLGSWQWPQTYEVRQLTRFTWCTQSQLFEDVPLRYEVTYKFRKQDSGYFEISHSNGHGGSTNTETDGDTYEELIEVLRQKVYKLGPMLLNFPLH